MILRNTKMYKKIFINITVIMVITILGLQTFIYNDMTQGGIQQQLEENEKITKEIANELEKIQENANLITRILYNSPEEFADISNFLEQDLPTYLGNKMERFSNSNKIVAPLDMAYFVKKVMSMSEQVASIALVGDVTKQKITYSADGDIDMTKVSDSLTARGEIKTEYDCIIFNRQIRDWKKQKDLGTMEIAYSVSRIFKKMDLNSEKVAGHNFLVLDQYGRVVYDAKQQYRYDKYPYLNGQVVVENELEQATNSYINTVYHGSGLVVVGQVPKSLFIPMQIRSGLTVFFMGFVFFVLGEVWIYIKMQALARRTDALLEAMHKVKKGDLQVRLPVGSEDDELTLLSENFNDMCDKLNQYIERTCLAELEQKKIEMEMFQIQINPHFLYNTLEMIRVQAICNGDREVGKMLYGLAVIFRSQLKENNIISLAKELHYAKKYIELLMMRYENCFTYEFVYEEYILENSILKFLIQPIIENYFVHGIRRENTDNYIRIGAWECEDGETLKIVIENNGRSIDEEKLKVIRQKLEEEHYKGDSLGIFNIQRRLTLYYGKGYRLTLENRREGGTQTTITIPRTSLYAQQEEEHMA